METKERMWIMMQKKLAENGEDCSYVTCDFGLLAYKEPNSFELLLQLLGPKQREYVEGLPWKAQRAYHRLDARMVEILRQLNRVEKYNFVCYFIKTGDKLTLASCSE